MKKSQKLNMMSKKIKLPNGTLKVGLKALLIEFLWMMSPAKSYSQLAPRRLLKEMKERKIEKIC